MKSLFLVCALVLSCPSFAANGVRLFDIHNAQFDQSLNLDSERRAQISVDYNTETVSLYAQHKLWKCAPGSVCIELMPVPFSTHLKIQSIEKDGCGVRTVTAITDNRASNGGYEEIRVVDGSDAICMYMVEVVQKAIYQTRYPKESTDEMNITSSSMMLKLNARAESWEQLTQQ
jgi:hypothetical protein